MRSTMRGQSGNPDSPHYRDLTLKWRDGTYFPLLFSKRAVERETDRRIHLVPGASKLGGMTGKSASLLLAELV